MIAVLTCDMYEDVNNLVQSKYRKNSIRNLIVCIKKIILIFCITLKGTVLELYSKSLYVLVSRSVVWMNKFVYFNDMKYVF